MVLDHKGKQNIEGDTPAVKTPTQEKRRMLLEGEDLLSCSHKNVMLGALCC